MKQALVSSVDQGGGERRADGHLIQEVVGPPFGRAPPTGSTGRRAGHDMIRDGVAPTLRKGFPEAAYDLARRTPRTAGNVTTGQV